MTTAARSVLANCELALTDFEAGASTEHWRSRFIALITGLRSVGLVLKATDYSVTSEAGKRAIDDAWARLKASKPEPRIFHEFIDVERYNATHLYAVNAAVNVTVKLGSLWVNVSTGESGSEPSGPTTYDYFMRHGPFKGQDPIQLCRDAMAFWRDYLDGIEGSTQETNDRIS